MLVFRNMARILIVGFGNPLRADDGLGWHIAKQLSDEHREEDVQVFALHQLTPEMAELASRSEVMLFIDADCKGKPGTLSCEQIHPEPAAGQFSHELSPATLLQLAKQLYGRTPAAYLLTIAGESFATGESLSPVVVKAIPALKDRIKALIDDSRKAG